MIPVPSLLYGTAWKEDRTAGLVVQAVEAGFRGIDTANQKKHYREDYVGDALVELAKKGITRDRLFLQSKFTFLEGQDHRLPYDPEAPVADQVRSSFENTLKNLHTDHVDSYVLHGPRSYPHLGESDWQAWSAMEELYAAGKTKRLGISNVLPNQLSDLVEKAKVKPHFVQNRCYAIRGWDKSVREFCRKNGIIYQGFSLLTANPHVVSSDTVASLARETGLTPQAVVFRFAIQIGILPLTGTTDPVHMKEDLQVPDLHLSDAQMKRMASIG